MGLKFWETRPDFDVFLFQSAKPGLVSQIFELVPIWILRTKEEERKKRKTGKKQELIKLHVGSSVVTKCY